ncbi:hypothetical protein RRG08_065942 [Elysia crispata]|uniref:Calcipressin-like protein n=1 Tax=Elysia crispata TaxID=231223 RepID=A0AAE0ZG24_9GAST|nr:hypothetical protein RRG08_065942 [Elysia crispata]
MSERVDQMEITDDIDSLCDDLDSFMDMSDLDDLPTAIIVTNVPASVFTDADSQASFEKIFLDIDSGATFVYLKNFKRVRAQFTSADTAGIARIKNDGAHVCGQPIRCYFFQIRTVVSDNQHLQLPKPTKMFLISPPASPPVGWESVPETEPVVNYDLLHAIASLNPGETHELHPSTEDAPAIVVHLCEDPVGFGNHSNLGAKQKIIGTRRPDISKAPEKRPPNGKDLETKSKVVKPVGTQDDEDKESELPDNEQQSGNDDTEDINGTDAKVHFEVTKKSSPTKEKKKGKQK